MEFREMAKEMTEKEIIKSMSILFDGIAIVEIKRDLIGNGIDVTFKVRGDETQKNYHIGLNASGVEDVPNGTPLRIDGPFMFEQFLVAKGYSWYWENNMFVED